MSKRIRPWDKQTRKIPSFSSNKRQSEAADVPYVTVDGIRYYSDRFYLNRTHFDDSYEFPEQGCTCGAKNPLPLFDRARLVASLKLKAVILATYTVDPEWLMDEFPSLFGEGATVPTLVLHGKKGWQINEENDEDNESDSDLQSPSNELLESPLHAPPVPQAESPTAASIMSQEETTCHYAEQFVAPGTPETPKRQVSTEIEREKSNEARKALPDHVHWTEVTTTWIPMQDVPPLSESLNSDGSVSQAILDKRLPKKGVHHPKFMILVEESGSVVVVVTTSNFTQPLSTDATWVQRFPAASGTTKKTCSASDGSDFGAVLANFLQRQTWACREQQLTPLGFVQCYLKWKSLKDLDRMFDYSNSQVHLVATVPGDHEGRHSHHERTFYYGRQRVAHILNCLTNGGSPWLPPILLSDNDRLIFQPTSFGSDWKLGNMTEVVRSYLGKDRRATDSADTEDQSCHSLIERMDIVWPTEDFIRETRGLVYGRKSPDSVSAVQMGFAPMATINPDKLKAEKDNEGCVFLSSDTFNKIDMTCLSQMVMFEPSVPEQRTPLTPHIKSIARMCELSKSTKYRMGKVYGFGKSEECFSWFMLTSACLSRGAQGENTTKRSPISDSVTYFNFELGILFSSRLQGRMYSDRLYCWKPARCSCGSLGGSKMIHLPSPFCFRPARYQEDEDEAYFCETPYFHEIPAGTASVGNMRQTPYGAALASKFANEAA